MNSRTRQPSTTDMLWPAHEAPVSPGQGEVWVWSCLLDAEPERTSALLESLSAEETHRASKFHMEELRQRFVVSRFNLRTILGGCLNIAPQEVKFRSDNSGKPHLVNEGRIQFNLAHTGNFMLLAVARNLSLGVDVEWIRRLKDSKAIARRFFSPQESNWLQAQNDNDLDRAFFCMWTRKEAVLKATGEGISGGISSVELLNRDGTFKQTVHRSAGNTTEAHWALHELHPAAGCIGALALPEKAEKPRIRLASFQAF